MDKIRRNNLSLKMCSMLTPLTHTSLENKVKKTWELWDHSLCSGEILSFVSLDITSFFGIHALYTRTLCIKDVPNKTNDYKFSMTCNEII